MATNANRKVVAKGVIGAFPFLIHDTGSAYLALTPTKRGTFSITNAAGIYESGHLEKLFLLFSDPDNSEIVNALSLPLRLEFVPKKEAALRLVLDSELSNSAKLMYSLSTLRSGVVLTEDIYSEIFAKRPDPLGDLKKLHTSNSLDPEDILDSLFPGFYSGRFKGTAEEYVSMFQLMSFLNSESSITYDEFKTLHEGENFIPYRNQMLTAKYNSLLPRVVDSKIVGDLYPSEYLRFATFFIKDLPKELFGWARKRFDSGIELFAETQSKREVRWGGSAYFYQIGKLLTEDEGLDFINFEKKNNLRSIVAFREPKSAALFAYYFVEGGPTRFLELLQHVISATGNRADADRPFSLSVNLKWQNPYAAKRRSTVDIAPYVSVLEQEGNSEYLLDWLLATA